MADENYQQVPHAVALQWKRHGRIGRIPTSYLYSGNRRSSALSVNDRLSQLVMGIQRNVLESIYESAVW